MSEFSSQQQIWNHLSKGFKVQCTDIKHVYGFKNGELWDFTKNEYAELFFYNAKDWVKYEQSNDFKGMTKLSNIARAFEELVKGNRVYKCYSNSTCKEWFSVGLVNGDLVYEDGSSGKSFFDDEEFDKFYIKENV
jgi:hypothetical protein